MAAPRLQTMYLLHLSNMVTGKSSYTFNFSEPLKQSRQGYKTPCVKLCAYPVDKRLCVVNTLQEYLQANRKILFIFTGIGTLIFVHGISHAFIFFRLIGHDEEDIFHRYCNSAQFSVAVHFK